MVLVTTVLVIGIRESARTNATLVLIKLVVVVFVIAVGWAYVRPANWTAVPGLRPGPARGTGAVPSLVQKQLGPWRGSARDIDKLTKQAAAAYRVEWFEAEANGYKTPASSRPQEASSNDGRLRRKLGREPAANRERPAAGGRGAAQSPPSGQKKAADSWGILGLLGLNAWLLPIDDATRTPFMPYGLSGIMLGASIVFFAYIGFDSISTHAEEARNPQRDVPIGILISLLLCTLLYVAVAGVITGMIPYPEIDIKAPIAVAFREKAAMENSPLLRGRPCSLLPAGWRA